MELLYRVRRATISSIGLAMVPVAITRMALKEVVTKVVEGCIVKIACQLMEVVQMAETVVG